jgi:beta-lactam-binding protein with PASTA domain
VIAQDELTDLGFSRIVIRSGNPKYSSVIASENWTVIGVEPAIGTPVDRDDLIVVTVTKP